MHREPVGRRTPPNRNHASPGDSAQRRPFRVARLAAAGALVLAVAIAAAWLGIGSPGSSPAASLVAGSPAGYVGSPAPSVIDSAGPVSDAPSSGPSSSPGAGSSTGPGPTPGPSTMPEATGEPGSQATPSPPAVPAARLQARLDRLRTKASLPGVSVAIVWDDGRTWTGVAGNADVAAGVPVTPDSGFALASISKTFTAAVVLELVDEGRLALDQRVAPLLPAYRINRRITVRMLLDHTSGLPDFFFNPTIDAKLQGAPDATWTAMDSWSLVARKRPRPGTVWAYSNTNYLLLGELVRAVTGHPLATEVRDRLLDPLGLKDTWYQVAEKPRTATTRGYRLVAGSGGDVRAVAVARSTGVMPFRSVVTAAGGAGSIASTALDTARWMQAFAGGRVLSPSMQAAMLADVANTRALDAGIPYGLGIQEVPIDGRTALGHSGRYLGYRNVVRYLPSEGVTIAVLTNQGVYDPAKIATALLRIVLPPLPSASPSPSTRP
jgi:D-alanyl-D-alanine carboxypeptidase